MIRRVAYGKAVCAGMTGAIAWEAVARPLILAGVPFADIVYLLGTTALPDSGAVGWWSAGMALHLVVGALWSIFYAYFFWAELPLQPALQGLLFSFVPMPLAIFVMRPQLELMNPLVERGQLPFSGLFGIEAGWHGPITIALGHLIWGAVLGWLYTRPVGYHIGSISTPQPKPRQTSRVATIPTPQAADLRFMFATGIESSYPTLEGGCWRMDLLDAAGHYKHWRTDLQLVQSLGLRTLRYGPPLHKVLTGPGRFDWSFCDEVVTEMQRLGIEPIMDLCHFGLPDWLGDFQSPEVPTALADYARAFARRYPSVRMYTPVNEMYVCARLSALEGLWNEQRRDEASFVTAVRHLARASVLMMQAISAERPRAVFVNSESSEFFQACCPDEKIRGIAHFENERRFLPLDLLYARSVSDEMRAHLRRYGMPDKEYDWFMNQDVRRRAILGVDYYDWNEKLIDREGHARSLGELFGWTVIASQYYERYRRPLMHTETNHRDAREAPRWLWRQWHNVQLLRQSGVPVVGFTWYSLIDQVDWDNALRESRGIVNPVGLFDLNRDVRTVGQAYRHLVNLFADEMSRAPTVESVLNAGSRPVKAERRHA
ncbi:MAG TPA: family 1 glycosylhydrolase [Burkholderiaceae bacterium]|nr:family 1 glycosylhydrolase [Burkholderiaceae bacterium]